MESQGTSIFETQLSNHKFTTNTAKVTAHAEGEEAKIEETDNSEESKEAAKAV